MAAATRSNRCGLGRGGIQEAHETNRFTPLFYIRSLHFPCQQKIFHGLPFSYILGGASSFYPPMRGKLLFLRGLGRARLLSLLPYLLSPYSSLRGAPSFLSEANSFPSAFSRLLPCTWKTSRLGRLKYIYLLHTRARAGASKGPAPRLRPSSRNPLESFAIYQPLLPSFSSFVVVPLTHKLRCNML